MRRTSFRQLPRHVLAIAACVALGATPRFVIAEPSAADFAEARELLNKGLDLRESGNARAALEKLRGANALAHTPITALELGRTMATLGQLVEAREVLLSVGRLPERSEETERSKAARFESEHLAEALRTRIATLTFRFWGADPGSTVLTLDGVALPNEALLEPRFVDPGHHQATARASDGSSVDLPFEIAEGETRSLDLAFPHLNLPDRPPEVTLPMPAGSQGTGRTAMDTSGPRPVTSHSLPIALIGTGAALAIAGTTLMAVESGRGTTASNHHDQDAYDNAKAWWIAGVATDVIGAGLAASGVLLLTLPRPSRRPTSSAPRLSATLGLNHWRLQCVW